MRIVGVIPAAGHATRLQPLLSSKEVYPIAGRPVMDYLVERMRAAPCDELRVVTRPEKRDVIDNARLHGATVVEAHPATLAESIYTGLDGLADDDIVLTGFPDSIWDPPDGYQLVLPLLRPGRDVALGLFKTDDLRRYEPVVFNDAGDVLRIEFKPEDPSSGWIWGCAVAQARTLRALEHEREPGVFFNKLSAEGRVAGVCLSDRYIDMGTHDGLRQAVAERQV